MNAKIATIKRLLPLVIGVLSLLAAALAPAGGGGVP
jgi:hypothetical protein